MSYINLPMMRLGLQYHTVARNEHVKWMPVWCPDDYSETSDWPHDPDRAAKRGWFNFYAKEPETFWFHEVLHWCVASPAQRRRPDFGLGRHVGAIVATESRSEARYNRPWTNEQLVTRRTATLQEQHACNLFPLWSVLYPSQRAEMLSAAYDFGTFELHRREVKAAVRAGWDGALERMFPDHDEASLVDAAWAEWVAAQEAEARAEAERLAGAR